MFIKVNIGDIKYDLVYPDDVRVLFLTGASSSSKTALINLKRQIEEQDNDLGPKDFYSDSIGNISSDKILRTTSRKTILQYITTYKSSRDLFLIDENDLIFSYKKLMRLIESSQANFILITREFATRNLNIDLDSVYELVNNGGVIILSKIIKSTVMTNIPNVIITEDKTEGYALPRLVYNNDIKAY